MEVLELNPQGLERIEHILAYDEEWASEIIDFLKGFPGFRPYAHLSPFTPRPVGHEKQFGEITDFQPETITEYLLYYICHTQAYPNVGDALWRKVFRATASEIEKTDYISDKKKETILAILNGEPLVSWQQVSKLNVKGVGLGAEYFIRTYFSDDFIDTTDVHFRRGLQLLCKTPLAPSREDIEAIVNTWDKQKKVGYLLCKAISHHNTK